MADSTLLSVTSPGMPDKSSGSRLSGPPSLPPEATRPAKKHMDALMKKHEDDAGVESSNPFVRKMAASAQISKGISQAVAADPSLSPIMAQILQAVQQAILGSLSGGPGGAPPASPLLPPPGMGMGAAPASPLPGPAVLPMPPPNA